MSNFDAMKMNILLIVFGLLLASIGIYRLLAVASSRPVGEKHPVISRPFVPDIPTSDAPHVMYRGGRLSVEKYSLMILTAV